MTKTLNMTRINVGIKPFEIRTKHLLAEHREIIRIPNNVKQGKVRMENIPTKFSLGTGHVKFFYNKLLYLFKRYTEIYKELIDRGCNIQNYESAWFGVPEHLMGDYAETDEDRAILIERLTQKDALIYRS